MAHRIDRCRICGNENLKIILDLGIQAMTGIFPRTREQVIERGPLQLLKCVGESAQCCGLVQLAHSFDPQIMYGEGYGYRSGLNASMSRHLQDKVARIRKAGVLRDGDLVVDIGSNDGTTLAAYPPHTYQLVGVDPTGSKFREFYPPHIELISDFFSLDTVRQHLGPKRARVVTSFSMFYDLEAPLEFMTEVLQLLEDDGIWVFEQCYLPAMLNTNGFDTVCHEHSEYYALSDIQWMAERAGGKIVGIEFNDVNGGSFSVTMSRAGAPYPVAPELAQLLERERLAGIGGLEPFAAFEARVAASRRELQEFMERAHRAGETVCGLGASTKGNVLLQYCGFTGADIKFIGEVNPDKFGCFTPATLIPIQPEADLFERKPDHTLVLPWHFRPFFASNAKFKALRLVFPLPKLEIQ